MKKFKIIFVTIIFVFCATVFCACVDSSLGINTDNKNPTSKDPVSTTVTLSYTYSRYVSAEWEKDQTAGMLYDFDGKYNRLGAQLYKGGGMIKGATNQTIENGKYGSEVTAIPYDGFEFIKWSDGLTDPTRKDKSTYCFNVVDSARKNVKYNEIYPLFAKRHTVYFRAMKGGHITGDLIQTIAVGKSGSELIATAEDGYIFMGWYLEDQYGMVSPGSLSNRITKSDTLIYDPFLHGFPQTDSYFGQGYIVAAFIEKI